MASEGSAADMDDPRFSQTSLGKRKRDDAPEDAEADDSVGSTPAGDDEDNDDSLFIPDENNLSLVPYGTIFEDEHEVLANSPIDDTDEEIGFGDGDAGDVTKSSDQTPYTEANESFPTCAIYNDRINAIVSALVGVPNKVTEVLSPHDFGGVNLSTHLKAAKELTILPTTKNPRAALIGNAGVGKSSTLNAITDIPDLAKSLAGGQSCTCVPTEYRGPFVAQIKKFAAVVRYFDSKSIRKLLIEYVEAWNVYTFESDPEWDEETRQMYDRRATSALATLQVLFRDWSEFSTRKLAKAYLAKCYREQDDQLIGLMLKSCEAKIKVKLFANGRYSDKVEESTTTALRRAIDPLLSSKSNGTEPALWPLVEQVFIGVRGSRVLDKLTIVDLPGISDTDDTRISLCKKYVKSCDWIWAVAPISRIIDDRLVFSIIHRYGKIFNGRIMIIATYSDADINNKIATMLEEEGMDMEAYDELGEQKQELATKYSALNDAIKKLRRPKKKTKAMLEEIDTKESALKRMDEAKKAVVAKRYECIVKSRNQYVAEQLSERMEDHLPENMPLCVHCISNEHYSAIKNRWAIEGGRLTAEGTGIPQLRADALRLAAPGLLRTMESYCQVNLLVLLKNVQLWVQTTTIERRGNLVQVAKVPLKKLDERIGTRSLAFTDGIVSFLTLPLHQQWESTRQTALEVFAKKQAKHPSTVRAFIRKNGNHSTQLCPKESWNEQFMRGITDFIGEHWESFNNSKGGITDDLEDALANDLRGVLVAIKKDHASSVKALPMARLEELVEAQIAAIETIFRDDIYAYSHDLRNILIDTTHDSDTNYFSRTIQPVYDSCKLDSGNGVTKRSMSRIESHLSSAQNKSPFTTVEHRLTKALRKNDDKHVVNIMKDKIGAILESLYNSFDNLIDRTVEDPREKCAREELKKMLPELERSYKEAMEAFAEVKARYEVEVMEE